ncbi:hypothetical protein KDK95_19715 [Actinospica sp. MGRD01-02]|uniref:Uncharacterized protein n=1 Tax=Actinospica acidithermotolerans TaxID=2828514 RepID=A0A941EG94_9ACTN|nr:hypothetical protein [Actinospica acidithermotolerans]MBR7828549.1 hypothetical protein [Actinospica acidithermotolerans]
MSVALGGCSGGAGRTAQPTRSVSAGAAGRSAQPSASAGLTAFPAYFGAAVKTSVIQIEDSSGHHATVTVTWHAGRDIAADRLYPLCSDVLGTSDQGSPGNHVYWAFSAEVSAAFATSGASAWPRGTGLAIDDSDAGTSIDTICDSRGSGDNKSPDITLTQAAPALVVEWVTDGVTSADTPAAAVTGDPSTYSITVQIPRSTSCSVTPVTSTTGSCGTVYGG